jgi:hypothetical protein
MTVLYVFAFAVAYLVIENALRNDEWDEHDYDRLI